MNDEVVTVKVTLESIYLKLLEVDKKVDPLPAQVRDHEARMRAVERRMWLWMGASAIGGGAVTQIGSALLNG